MHRNLWLPLALIAAAVLLTTPANAADPDAGRLLAQKNCARCHAIGHGGDSPHAKAPPFTDVVKRYPPASLDEALAEGISVGHADMPEFVFSPREIDNLISYLELLQ